MQLVIPMSGQGKRFQEAGYTKPKPIISINGKTIIERLLSRFPESIETFFILSEDHRNTELPKVLNQLRPNGKINYIPAHKLGPGHAIEQVLSQFDSEKGILVSYCDYDMEIDYESFRRFVKNTECDSCLISYRGFHAHYINPQTYAYSRMEGERVVEVKEKGSFTDNRENEYASCGAYYFKNAKTLKIALESQQKNNLILNGEYYISLTVEALLRIKSTAHVRVYEIPYFYQFGTPQDLENFAFWERSYSNASKIAGQHPSVRPTVEQVLIPMAGLGSRFKTVTEIPKPFIPIREKAMVYHATKSLPSSSKTIWVTLEEVSEKAEQAAKDLTNTSVSLIALAKTPEGQALTTLEGLNSLDPGKEVIISACDHGIVLSSSTWSEFKKLQKVDAAIFSIQNFPGARRTPNSFAYVETNGSQLIAPIQKISVKKPLSSNPYNDLVLVGTFWVSSVPLLRKYIEKLVSLNHRVNNELYLDSAFKLMVQDGLNVVNIPLDGYLGWGDPDSLAEAMYWDEVFNGRKISKRKRYPDLEV